MKKCILTIIICGIVFTSIGVFAGSYNAKQISYTPNDNTWNVKNVSTALDSIKNSDKTQIANLQSAISNKDTTINELNSQIEEKDTIINNYTSNFNELVITGIASGTGTSQVAILSYKNIYDKFKITIVSGSCTTSAYSAAQSANLSLSINTEYLVASSTDNKKFSHVIFTTNNSECTYKVTLYN